MNTADYSTWSSPNLSVAYLLPLFHEIDFTVNEGYRRIPHGGVETGGLLFGTRDAQNIRIEAFRLIECEHAFGPSFQLSDRDVERIRQQLAAAITDGELSGMVPLGWFIAHTRSELVLSDREAALFDELFPDVGALTVLVKPEKFKPTRFAFFPREPDGAVSRDGTQSSIILPLPGRAARAPKPRLETVAPPETLPPPEPEASPVNEPIVEPEPVQTFTPPEPPAPQLIPEPKPAIKAEPLQFPRRVPTATSPLSGMFVQPAVASEPSVYDRARQRQQTRQQESTETGAWGTLHWVMLSLTLACALVVAYGVYLRMQPAFIPVTAAVGNNALVISWPSTFTRDAEDATVRVNDGLALALPPTDRLSGTTTVPNNANSVKVELSVHRWLHDGRGIVHYVTLPSPPATKPTSARTGQTPTVRHSFVPRTPVFPPVGSEGLQTTPPPQ